MGSAESDDLSSDEELLGWEIDDLCSFANDMQAAAKRFARSFACVEYFGYNDAKNDEFNTKRVHKQLKRNNKQLRNSSSETTSSSETSERRSMPLSIARNSYI